MKHKKTLVLLLIMVMITMLASGCSRSNVGNEGTTSTQTKDEVDELAGENEHLEFTWLALNDSGYPAINNTWAQKIFEERFNVTIKVFEVDCHNDEKMALFWAEGNRPDVIQWNSGHKNWMLVDQDIIRPISEDMMIENMPNVMKINDQEMGLDVGRGVLTYKGKYWGIPVKVYRENAWLVEVVRKDWMENVGINKAPETLDEYYEMLKRFTYNDPDGNGEDDTCGIHGASWMQFSYIQSAFGGAYKNAWQYWDGEIINSSTTERYKEMLKTLQKWYEEGLIDPEMITDDRTIQREKWSDGKFGVLCDAPSWLWSTEKNGPLAMLKNKNPDAEVIAISPIRGSYGAYRMGGVGADLSQAVWFGKNASDDVVLRIMQAYEEISKDKELYIKLKYGEEGKDFVYNNDGTIRSLLTPEERQEKGLSQVGMFCGTSKGREYYSLDVPEEDLVYYDVMEGFKTASFHPIGFLTDGPNQVYLDKNADIDSIISEFYFNAIAGAIDIDAEWGNYISKLEKAGLTAVQEEFKAIFTMDPIK